MQTFLPYADFAKSAACLDNRRLGKQRVECLQILQALAKGPYTHYGNANNLPMQTKKTPWYNHPATQMWKGYTNELVQYGVIICDEWIKRGFKDTCREKIQSHLFIAPPSHMGKTPPWLGNEAFHASHRAALLVKDYNHYKQFGWTEKPALNYIWPTP